MLKAIIFDMDGVLVDSMSLQADSWYTVFKEIGIEIKREDIYLLEGSNARGIIKAIFEKAGKKPEPEQIEYLAKKKKEVFNFDLLKPFKGTLDCLKELKPHFTLAAVSGSSSFTVGRAINKFFPGFFDVIITGDEMENGKPDPDPYLKALQRLDLDKNECFVVENSPFGITAAKRAKLYCVAVASTLEPEKLQHADIVFGNHTALFDYLKSLTPK